jgi:hypothetical protein
MRSPSSEYFDFSRRRRSVCEWLENITPSWLMLCEPRSHNLRYKRDREKRKSSQQYVVSEPSDDRNHMRSSIRCVNKSIDSMQGGGTIAIAAYSAMTNALCRRDIP